MGTEQKMVYTMTRKEAADRLNVSVSMVRRFEATGDLHTEKRDNDVYLDPDEVEALAAARGELAGDRQLVGRLMQHVESLMRTRSQTVEELREQCVELRKELGKRDERIADLQGKTTEVLKTLEEAHRERIKIEMEREKMAVQQERERQTVEVMREGLRSAKLLVPALAARLSGGKLPNLGADPRIDGLLTLVRDLRADQVNSLGAILDSDQRALAFAVLDDLRKSASAARDDDGQADSGSAGG